MCNILCSVSAPKKEKNLNSINMELEAQAEGNNNIMVKSYRL
jgi:hypothetical protein